MQIDLRAKGGCGFRNEVVNLSRWAGVGLSVDLGSALGCNYYPAPHSRGWESREAEAAGGDRAVEIAASAGVIGERRAAAWLWRGRSPISISIAAYLLLPRRS